MNFLRSSVWSGLSVAIRAIVQLLIGKMFAMMGGNGVTLFNHFQNLIAIFTSLTNNGINKGIIKYVADPAIDAKEFQKYFQAGLILNVLFFALTALGLFFTGQSQLEVFSGAHESFTDQSWTFLLVLGILALILHLLFMAVMLGKGYLRDYVLINIGSSLISVLLVWLVYEDHSIRTALLAYLGGQSLIVIASLSVLWLRGILPKMDWTVDRAITKDLGKFILMAASMMVFTKAVDYFVRLYMIEHLAASDVEDWQSAVYISSRYLLVFTSVMSMVYYPKIASLLTSPEELKNYVRRIFYWMGGLAIPALFVVWIFRGFWLEFLLSRDHGSAAYLFYIQVIGDWFFILVFMLDAIVHVRAQVSLFIAVNGMAGLVYVLSVVFLVAPFGVEGLITAYGIKQLAMLTFYIVYFRKVILRLNKNV